MKRVRIWGKNIGIIKDNPNEPKTFISIRTKKKHFFRKYNGYGISTTILSLLKNSNIQKIIIIEIKNEDTQNKLTTTVNTYYHKGIYHKNKQDNQIILPIQHFTKEE